MPMLVRVALLGIAFGFSLAVAASVGAVSGEKLRLDRPSDSLCVSWMEWTNETKYLDGKRIIAAAHTYITEIAPTACIDTGYVIPCISTSDLGGAWGHHDYNATVLPADYCRTWVDGEAVFAQTFYLPERGPEFAQWHWLKQQAGDAVPAHAVRSGSFVLARSTHIPPGECTGAGFTGWVSGPENGTLGHLHLVVVSEPATADTFEVAVCDATGTAAPETTTMMPTTTTTTSVPRTMAPTSTETTRAPMTTTTSVPATTAVPTTTMAPPPPPTPQSTPNTFSPTLPPDNKPYIRFGNTIASANSVTATIAQGKISYTWTDYPFGTFSNWVELFDAGDGEITVYDSASGTKLMKTSIPLTPGPLVVVVKGYWPPTRSYDVETIAASYVPPPSGSGVRLFNLSPNTAGANMTWNGKKTLATDVLYTLGSDWADVPVSTATYTVSDFNSGAVLATNTVTAPPNPFVFTNFLIGLQNATNASFTTQLVALVDAPEF